MTEPAAGFNPSRPRPWIAGLALAAALLAATVRLPERFDSTMSALSRMRQHDGWRGGSRSVLGPPLHDALAAADTLLPQNAVVLLVTPGRDWRRNEYVAFHRALYVLAPRPVWWATPAQRDGSWESLWWSDLAPATDATAQVAKAKNASHILAVGHVGWELPGYSIRELPGGARLSALDSVSNSVRSFSAWQPAPSPAGALPAIAVVLLAGWALTGILIPRAERKSAIIRLALSWLLGAGAVSLAMFWMILFGVSPQSQRLVVIVLALAGAIWINRREGATMLARRTVSRLRQLSTIRFRYGKPRLASLICGVLALWVIAELVGVFVRGMSGPLSGWDGWVTWAMKARVLHLQADSSALLMDASREISNRSYPLLLPLTEAWVYGWVGGADDRFAAIVTSSFLLALLVLMVASLRDRLTCVFSLGMTVVFLASPYAGLLGSLGYADVVLAAYALACALALRQWQASGSPALAAVLAALLPWVKAEGMLLAIALLSAAFISTRTPMVRRRLAGAAALAIAVCAVPWYLLVAQANPAHRAYGSGPLLTTGRASDVIIGLLARAVNPDWHGLWIVAAVGIALLVARGRWRSLLPLAICAYLAVIAFVFLFSRYEPLAQHVLRSADRLLLHIAPLAVLLVADLIGGSNDSRLPASEEPAEHHGGLRSV